MAITFTSYDTGIRFLIGGQSVTTGTDDGSIGTMPTFSITRNETLLADGTYVGSVFDINITGTARTVGNLDISTKGASQTAIQELALKDLQFNKAAQMFGNGKLEISPYGGMPNTISFDDARIINIEIPEQDENSSGTQYLQYTFNFQATVDSSVTNNSNWGLNVVDPTYKLKTASENWDLAESQEFSYANGVISNEDNKYKTYTLTHTISAQGIRKYSGTQLDPDNGHAWRQAAGWVKSRLDVSSDPSTTINEDLMGNDSAEIKAKFNAFYMNKSGVTAIKNLSSDGYVAKNKTRTINSDISNGSYSITDAWLVTQGNINATHTIEVSIDNSISDEKITITANGTVNGLSTVDVDDQNTDKYTNALTEYNKFFTSASSLNQTQMGLVASQSYSKFSAVGQKTGQPLTAQSISESHDKVNGTISWNVSFSDQYIGYEGASSQKITYSYTNDHYLRNLTQKPSVIEVISNGPLIYTPGTTDEKTMTVSVDLTMTRDYRNAVPNGISLVDTSTVVSQYFGPIETNRSESWNPTTGVYNLSVTYTYA
jgi:hypothetical protein